MLMVYDFLQTLIFLHVEGLHNPQRYGKNMGRVDPCPSMDLLG